MPVMMESERKARLDQLGLLFTLLSPDSFEKFASSLEKEASKSLTKRILSQVSRQKLTAFINKISSFLIPVLQKNEKNFQKNY